MVDPFMHTETSFRSLLMDQYVSCRIDSVDWNVKCKNKRSSYFYKKKKENKKEI